MLYGTKPFSFSDFSLSLKSPLTLRILKKNVWQMRITTKTTHHSKEWNCQLNDKLMAVVENFMLGQFFSVNENAAVFHFQDNFSNYLLLQFNTDFSVNKQSHGTENWSKINSY